MGVPRSLAGAAAALLLGGLTACGGGGGGSGGGGSDPTPLQYSGNTNAAVITTSNASALAAIVTGGNEAQGGQGQLEVGRRLIRTVRATVAPGGNPRFWTPDRTDPCAEGGTVGIFGYVTVNGVATVTVVYTNCTVGGDAVTGQGTMRIDRSSVGIPVDYTLTFDRLAMRGVSNSDITGAVHVVTDIPTNTETATENTVSLYVGTGRMTKSENLLFVDTYDDVTRPARVTETVSGRIFDGVHGYVDIATLSPLFFAPATRTFPNGGLLQLTGAQNRRILFTQLSSDMVRLTLDLNADGQFETAAMLTRAQLSGPVGADLADSDGDGLHNGWESEFGAADPAADSDRDDFSALSEYQGGGNPNDGSVRPKLAAGVFQAAKNLTVANSGWWTPGKISIASDGKNYLIVSCRETGPHPPIATIFGVLVSDMGQVLNNFPLLTGQCGQAHAVGFDGSNYLVVLQRNVNLVGFRISPTGTILTSGEGFDVTSTADGTSNVSPAVAFDGTNYLVVWRKPTGIHAARVSPAGVVLDSFAVTSGANGLDFAPAVAFGGGNYLVAWTNGPEDFENVFAARVSPAGVVLDTSPVAIATAADRQIVAGVASDGTNYLVVWNNAGTQNIVPPPEGKVFARRIGPDMRLLDGAAVTDGIAISTGPTANHSASVTYTGSTFLVTWAIGSLPSFPPVGIYAARVSKRGECLDGPAAHVGVSVSGPPGAASQYILPVAASSGKSTLVGWVDIYGGGDGFKDVLAALVFGP